MKIVRSALFVFALAALFPLAASAHAGIDHEKENAPHEEKMSGEKIGGIVFAAGFVIFAAIVVRDKHKRQLLDNAEKNG